MNFIANKPNYEYCVEAYEVLISDMQYKIPIK